MKSKKYIDFIRTLPCCHCKAPGPGDPHHLIGIGLGSMGATAPDIAAVPLCRKCHTDFHNDPIGWPQPKWLVETLSKALNEGVMQI